MKYVDGFVLRIAMDNEPMPFDMKRMASGGFEVLVEA